MSSGRKGVAEKEEVETDYCTVQYQKTFFPFFLEKNPFSHFFLFLRENKERSHCHWRKEEERSMQISSGFSLLLCRKEREEGIYVKFVWDPFKRKGGKSTIFQVEFSKEEREREQFSTVLHPKPTRKMNRHFWGFSPFFSLSFPPFYSIQEEKEGNSLSPILSSLLSPFSPPPSSPFLFHQLQPYSFFGRGRQY